MPEYPAGTVAVATVRGVPDVRVMAGHGTTEPKLRWVTTDNRLIASGGECWFFDYQVTDVRPLAVLDLEYPGLCANVLRECATEYDATVSPGCEQSAILYNIADQIEAPTKPAEPARDWRDGDVVQSGYAVYERKGGKWRSTAHDGIFKDRVITGYVESDSTFLRVLRYQAGDPA